MNEKTTPKTSDKPGTRSAWQPLILAIAAALVPPALGLVDLVLRPLLDPASVNPAAGFRGGGVAGLLISLALSILAIITGFRLLQAGERSWVVWAGIVVALLVASFWIILVVWRIL